MRDESNRQRPSGSVRVTARQKEVLDFVTGYIGTNHFAPSIREIAEHFGFSSPAAAANHLRALERKGLLRTHGTARSIEILGGRLRSGSGIPVLGKVPAGTPVLAVETFDDWLSFERLYGEKSDLFALRVRGESMTGAGIFDGDFVVVRSQREVRNGEIGIVLVGDEADATVKRIFIDKEAIRLQPENPSLEPMIFSTTDASIRVVGKVIGVVRKI